MNYPMRRTDFRMFRHTDNEIDFLLKNFDRRVIDVTDGYFEITIVTPDEKRVLMKRPLTIVDSKLGWVRFFATGDEVATFPVEQLYYAVVWRKSNGIEVPCYTDRDRKITGYIDITPGIMPPPRPPYILDTEDFTPMETSLFSSAIAGPARSGNIMGAMSMAARSEEFRGKLTIEGSMHEQPSTTQTDWFVVHEMEFDRYTGMTHYGFEGNLQWVRFKVSYHRDALDPRPLVDLIRQYGRITEIVFRN